MKVIRSTLLGLALMAATGSAFAHGGGVGFSISIGSPGYYYGPPVVAYAPPPVVYYSPPAVYYRDYAPRVYYRSYAPRYRYGHEHRGWGRHGWRHHRD